MNKYYLYAEKEKVVGGEDYIKCIELYENDKLIYKFNKEHNIEFILECARKRNVEFNNNDIISDIDTIEIILGTLADKLEEQRKNKKDKKDRKIVNIKKAKIILTTAAVTAMTMLSSSLIKKSNNKKEEDVNIHNTAIEYTSPVNITNTDNIKDTFERENITFTFNNVDRSNDMYVQIVYDRYKDYIDEASLKYGIDPNLITAIIVQENKFDVRNSSNVGGHGPMQVEQIHNKENISFHNFLTNQTDYTGSIDIDKIENDPKYGIEIGCAIFNNTYKNVCEFVDDNNINFNDQEKVLATIICYNKGFYGLRDELLKSNNFSEFVTLAKNSVNSNGQTYGDPDYLFNVSNYIPDEKPIYIKNKDNSYTKVIFDNLNINEDIKAL